MNPVAQVLLMPELCRLIFAIFGGGHHPLATRVVKPAIAHAAAIEPLPECSTLAQIRHFRAVSLLAAAIEYEGSVFGPDDMWWAVYGSGGSHDRRGPEERRTAIPRWWSRVQRRCAHVLSSSTHPAAARVQQDELVPDISELLRNYRWAGAVDSGTGLPVLSSPLPCGAGLSVSYAKDKLLDIARDACPPDAQPDPSWDKVAIVRHVLAN